MKRLTVGTLASGAALMLGAASASAQDMGQPFFEYWRAEPVMEAARSADAPADPHQRALFETERRYAEFEYGEMQDFADARYHANRALRAGGGEPLEPQSLTERSLPPEHADALGDARARLMEALANDARRLAPEASGEAIGHFDCWIEQQEENFQPDHIANCRDAFNAAMDTVAAAMPEPEPETPMPEQVTLSADVLFDFDRAEVKPEAEAELDEVVALLEANPEVDVTVEGHTDSVGSERYNLELSERRAQSVVDYLTDRGIDEARLTVRALGESEPVADNSTEEGRALNRRVEIERQ